MSLAITTRSTVLASVVLALALMGDSLLYAILPLNAQAFGISVGAVGIMLAANRIVRLVAFRAIARLTHTVGLRRITVAAAVLGCSSTLVFAFAEAFIPLLLARIVWGLSYGALALTTLAYATAEPAGAGSRIGVSLSIREIGPLLALAAGGLLLSLLPPQIVLGAVGAVSMIAIPVALALPDVRSETRNSGAPVATLPQSPHDLLSAAIGFVVDGVFVTTIGFALTEKFTTANVAGMVATVLIVRRILLAIVSPAGGRILERYGANVVLLSGSIAIAVGATLIATSNVVAGCALLIAGSALAVTALPVAATAGLGPERIDVISRLNVSRDAGAAVGPLVAVTLYQALGTSWLFLGSGALVALISLIALRVRTASGREAWAD